MTIRHSLSLLAGVSFLAACAAQPSGTEPIGTNLQQPAPAPKTYTMSDLKIPQQGPQEPPLSPVTSHAFPDGARPSEGALQRGVAAANERALELPVLDCFSGATCEYWYQPDQQYLVYMAALNQTLTCVKPGEIIRDVVMPGKQTYIPHQRYISGSGDTEQQCVAWMPTMGNLDKQAAILTDRNRYKLRIKTFGKNSKNLHVEVRWRYPEDVLRDINNPGQPIQQRDRDRTTGMSYRDRYCDYEVSGSTPAWMPEPTADKQPPVCDDGEVTIINFPIGVGFLGGRPSVWRLNSRDERVPVQFGAINSTYRVVGVHDRLMLGLGAEEVIYERADPVSVRTPPATRTLPAQGPATAGGGS